MTLCVMSALLLTTTTVVRRPPAQDAAPRVIQAKKPTDNEQQMTVLLLGMDESGVRPDSIMLVRVKKNSVTMFSVPRDTKVDIRGSARKINACIVYGGRELLTEKIGELTGAAPDRFVSMKPGAFAAVVDALGGVEYTVERNMYYSDPAQGLYIRLDAGRQTLDGKQCEHYCRYRQYLMGDLTRTEHQQKLLKALIEQKMTPATLTALPRLWKVVAENVETDLTLKDITSFLPVLREMAAGKTEMISHTLPGEYNDMRKEGVCFYLPDESAAKTLWQQG